MNNSMNNSTNNSTNNNIHQQTKKVNKKKLVIINDIRKAAEVPLTSANLAELLHSVLEKYTALNNKYHEMEKKMKSMEEKLADNTKLIPSEKSSSSNGKKRYNVLDRLNNSKEGSANIKTINHLMNFADFVSEVNQTHLKIAFRNKYEDGYVLILLDLLNLYEKKNDFKFIRAFNEQVNILYVYKNTNWTILSEEDLMIIINKIYKCMISEFTKWQNDNIKQLKEDDDLANEYSTQLIKIIGNPASKYNFCNIIIKKLYKQLKTNFIN